MDLNVLIDEWGIEPDTIILEPQSEFNGAIIGISDDRRHLIYSYEKMVELMTKVYCDSEMIAHDWIDYNTMRALPYMNQEYVPIIIHEFVKE